MLNQLNSIYRYIFNKQKARYYKHVLNNIFPKQIITIGHDINQRVFNIRQFIVHIVQTNSIGHY